MAQQKDYYEILGVERNASTNDIKAAYRKMALKYHPDRNPGDKKAEEQFKQVAHAYEILSDQQKRARYDQFGHAGVDNTSGMGNHGGHHSGYGQEADINDIFSNLNDVFGDFFNQGNQSRKRASGMTPRTGHDLAKEITISLKESFIGSTVELSYTHFLSCPDCKGKGAEAGTKVQKCTVCDGIGQIQHRQGFFVYAQACTSCQGEGFIIPNPCTGCNGRSRIQKHERFSVNIPAGITDGAELRVNGKGDAGIYGGKSGNLILKIMITPDATFSRKKDDLVCSIMLTYPQLVFGCQVDIISIDGSTETIKIPKGCPVGEEIVIVGKGFMNISNKLPGNFVIKTQCIIPKKISAQAKKILVDYNEALGQETTNTQTSGILNFFKKFLS